MCFWRTEFLKIGRHMGGERRGSCCVLLCRENERALGLKYAKRDLFKLDIKKVVRQCNVLQPRILEPAI